MLSIIYPFIYCVPRTTTAASFVNNARSGAASTCIITAINTPYTLVIIVAYLSVFAALSYFPAPIFWAESADTVASIDDGIMNIALIIFSTIPTAAASSSPLWLAITVIIINATCIHPS